METFLQDLLLTLSSFSTGLSASVLWQHTCSLSRSLCVGHVSLSKLCVKHSASITVSEQLDCGDVSSLWVSAQVVTQCVM